ncbi:helix-turn-helix domain-containing protein [Fontivita pretiosa]|uniref:helix-turn-helix domain-containing protein n=1 Tax=Fontivita pretiosa TaxID=2989684 RepID=UPI003D17380B
MQAGSISDRLREAILRSGQSRYAIARATGISQAALSRFMSGKRGLSLGSADKLAEYFGLQLLPASRRRKDR